MEGETADAAVEAVRDRQVRNNEISWFDWDLLGRHAGLLRFWQAVIAFRKRHFAVRAPHFFDGRANERGVPDVTWHGTKLNQPGWDAASSCSCRAASVLSGAGPRPAAASQAAMRWTTHMPPALPQGTQ